MKASPPHHTCICIYLSNYYVIILFWGSVCFYLYLCLPFCCLNLCVLQGVWHGSVIIILTLICREINNNDNLNKPYNALSPSLSVFNQSGLWDRLSVSLFSLPFLHAVIILVAFVVVVFTDHHSDALM